MKALRLAALVLAACSFGVAQTHSDNISRIALNPGHSYHFINVNHVTVIHVVTDFPVTIRERGCMEKDVMDAVFTCRFGQDVYISDQRHFWLPGDPNIVKVNWAPTVGDLMRSPGN